MKKLFVRVLGYALFFVLTACGGGGGGSSGGSAGLPAATATPVSPTPASPTTPAATGHVVFDLVQSKATNASYPLTIYIPSTYDGSSAAFPVIYATEGDAAYAPNGRFENFRQILVQRNVQAILVGIGGTARRDTDFPYPGFPAYHDFLTKELVPFIEAKYRADTSKRVLSGLSLGGSATGYAFLLEGTAGSFTFSYFVSTEGSYSFQQGQTDSLEQALYDAQKGKQLPATLILARCVSQSGCNLAPVDRIYQKLLSRNYAGLTLVENTYSDSHVGTDVPAFNDAMALIFK